MMWFMLAIVLLTPLLAKGASSEQEDEDVNPENKD